MPVRVDTPHPTGCQNQLKRTHTPNLISECNTGSAVTEGGCHSRMRLAIPKRKVAHGFRTQPCTGSTHNISRKYRAVGQLKYFFATVCFIGSHHQECTAGIPGANCAKEEVDFWQRLSMHTTKAEQRWNYITLEVLPIKCPVSLVNHIAYSAERLSRVVDHSAGIVNWSGNQRNVWTISSRSNSLIRRGVLEYIRPIMFKRGQAAQNLAKYPSSSVQYGRGLCGSLHSTPLPLPSSPSRTVQSNCCCFCFGSLIIPTRTLASHSHSSSLVLLLLSSTYD